MRINGLGWFGARHGPSLHVPEWMSEERFPDGAAREGRRRRSDRTRVEAGRVNLAKFPGTVERVTRAEAASMLGCSIRQVQRLERERKLDRCPQHGREVTYVTRDVRQLASALGKGR
jgi:hypothetical protein